MKTKHKTAIDEFRKTIRGHFDKTLVALWNTFQMQRRSYREDFAQLNSSTGYSLVVLESIVRTELETRNIPHETGKLIKAR